MLLLAAGRQLSQKAVQKNIDCLEGDSSNNAANDDDEEEEPGADKRNCVAMQNLALLAKHAPAQLHALDLESIIEGIKTALGKKQISRTWDEGTVLWYEAAIRFLYHRTARQDYGTAETAKSFVKTCLDLLWNPKAFEEAKRSAIVCLLHLWSDKDVQAGGIFSTLDLARLAWSIPALGAETRNMLNAKLFKLTRTTNSFSFVAFQAFFVLQPEASLLPKSKQFLLNSVLLRRRNLVAGEVPPEFFSFFLLVPCLMHASAQADARAVLTYYIKTIAAPQRGEKEDHRASLAQVIFAVQRLFVRSCTTEPPLAPRIICELALEILGVTPERGGLSLQDIRSKLPWLRSFYTFEKPKEGDIDDQQEEGADRIAFSAPPRVRKTPTTPLKNKRTAPDRRQRSTPAKAVKKPSATKTKRRRTSPSKAAATASPVTPSRRSLPRSCKNHKNVLDSSEDEEDHDEEEVDGDDTDGSNSSDENSQSEQDEREEEDDDDEEEEDESEEDQTAKSSTRPSTRSAPFRTR